MKAHLAKGYLMGAVAAIAYGLNPLFALPCYDAGMSPASVLFFRYLLAIPVMGLMLWVRRGHDEFSITPRQTLMLCGAGILMAVSSLSLFESYTYMDAGIASTLLFIYPIMVALIMALWFKERFSLMSVFCIVVAMSGIWLVGRTAEGMTVSLTGATLVFVSSLTYALYIVGINKSQLETMATLKVIFYVLVFGLLVITMQIFLSDSAIDMPPTPLVWLNILGLAVIPTALSFVCTTDSIQYIGATPTAILGALEPLTAVVVGVLVFGESMTPRIASGIFLILLAVSVIVAGENLEQHLLAVRRLFPRRRRK